MNTSIETTKTPIINGNFQKQADAERTVKQLADAGFASDQIATIAIGLAEDDGLHQSVDNDEAPAAGGAATGAAAGGAIGAAVGVAAAPILGPAAAAAALGVGAYTGSLYGALNTLGSDDTPDAEEADTHPPTVAAPRSPGTWVATAATDRAAQSRAIDILIANGATEIECSEGHIINGGWTDFDPTAPIQPVRTG